MFAGAGAARIRWRGVRVGWRGGGRAPRSSRWRRVTSPPRGSRSTTARRPTTSPTTSCRSATAGRVRAGPAGAPHEPSAPGLPAPAPRRPVFVSRAGSATRTGWRRETRLASASRPDAVVAVNDEAAIGVVMTLRQAGVDVPSDMSVAGIDNTRPARFVELTTIGVPLHELGAAAARGARGRRTVASRPLALPHRLDAARRRRPGAGRSSRADSDVAAKRRDRAEQLVAAMLPDRRVDHLDLDRPVVAAASTSRGCRGCR